MPAPHAPLLLRPLPGCRDGRRCAQQQEGRAESSIRVCLGRGFPLPPPPVLLPSAGSQFDTCGRCINAPAVGDLEDLCSLRRG